MKRLEENGLTRTEKRSRYHCVYHLLKVRCNTDETQMLHRGNSGVIYFDTNDNNITRDINNNVREDNLKHNRTDEFIPETRQELLALDLAEALNDRKALLVYLSYARKYPESLLRRILVNVKEIPADEIKKSRAALFIFLIKKYAQESDQNHRAQPRHEIHRVCHLSWFRIEGLGDQRYRWQVVKRQNGKSHYVAIEFARLPQARCSSNKEAEAIEKLSKSKQIGKQDKPTFQKKRIDINELKRHFQSRTRRELVEKVTEEYPFLSHELSKERANMNPYYIRMFEAVALGSICFSHPDSRK